MARPSPLRDDIDGSDLFRLARATNDADQVRRLLSLAAIYDGGTARSECKYSLYRVLGQGWVRTFPSAASGISYDNALAETVIGLFKTEIIHRRGPWRSFESVEFATLEWVDWFNNRSLLELCRAVTK